jgi:leucine dehydrogenase
MAVIRRETSHVRGLPGESGDTSPATGYGVFQAMRAAVEHRMGRHDLTDLRVAVQGAGAVGRALMRHLHVAGARIMVADVNEAAVVRAVQDYGALAVNADDILFEDVDVVAPCALGAVLNDDTIPQIRAAIVCGGANNQLAEGRHATMLADRDILFVPDYVANAGGAINAVREGPDYDEAEAMAAVEGIHETCLKVLMRAATEDVPPSVAADRLAAEIIGR